MLNGDNSILYRATDAKKKTEKAQDEETISLAYLAAITGNYTNGEDISTTLTDELEKTYGSGKVNVEKDGNVYKVSIDGKGDYTIDGNGKVEKFIPIPITSIAIENTSATVSANRKITLTATKEPTNSTEDIKWICETPTIANIDEKTGIVKGISPGTAIIKATNQDGSIISSSTCTLTVTEAISEIEEGINPETYGRIVNYDVDLGKDADGNNLTWKVFYDDGTNVYLIASDYVQITNNNLASTLSTIGANTSEKYNVYWNDTDKNFKTYKTQDATEVTISNGAEDIFSNTAPTGTKYLVGRGLLGFWKNQTTTKDNDNAKMTACFMDTKAWSSFVAPSCNTATNYNSSNCYAIGSPTISIWTESWNAKHGENSKDTNKIQLYYSCNSASGYQSKEGEKPKSDNYNIDMSKLKLMDGFNDTLYFPHKDKYENCYGYWLSSPSFEQASREMFSTYYENWVWNEYKYNYLGVRPLVCLPSNVKISDTPNQDGSYNIINK